MAQVACKQLGFSAKGFPNLLKHDIVMLKGTLLIIFIVSYTDPFVYQYQCFFDVISALPFLITEVQCTSNETQLSQCNYESGGITSCNSIVGIKCQLTKQSEKNNTIDNSLNELFLHKGRWMTSLIT